MSLDLLAAAALADVKNGYVEQRDHYLCLFCGREVEKGIIYPDNGLLYDASRYIRLHIQQAHGSPFQALLSLGKQASGLSEHQMRLLELFYLGQSDADVQETMGIGSASTIRNHRFVLRERERQAKVFLAMMELLREKDGAEKGQPIKKEASKAMDRNRKKELLEQYKQEGPQAGVYQIRNTKNNKVFIEVTPNLKTINGAPGPLNNGMHPNHELQTEWKEYGEDAFVFEVLEVLKKKDDESFDIRDELKKLKHKWLEQLQPYGDRGYHPEPGKGGRA